MARFSSSLPRHRALPLLTLAVITLCGRLAGVPASVHAFELLPATQLVNPAITSRPIEVVLWVRDTVSTDDEAWVTDEIRAGLALWEQVETSQLRFTIRIVRSQTPPTVAPEHILVTVANRADLTAGGATLPNGLPGQWRGAVADFRDLCGTPCERFRFVAAHEIGHTLGLLHSTISRQHFDTGIPLMNFAPSSTGLSPDDVAAVSTAYPNQALPLHAVSATLLGRCVDPVTLLPVTGVNVVAVDRATGTPTVARLSGAAGDAGRFAIVGLPPATYDLHFLDGTSFAGSFFGLSARAVQTDNFTPFSLGPLTVAAGEVRDLAHVPIPISQVEIAAAHIELPEAIGGSSYDVSVEIHGGVRPLALAGHTGLPDGLAASLLEREEISNKTAGGVALRLHGSPRDVGQFTPTITVADTHGVAAQLRLDLRVDDTLANTFCADGPRITDISLTLAGLTTPPGDEALTLSGTVVLPAPEAAILDPATSGMQVHIEDLGAGGSVVFELSSAPGNGTIDGSPIPPHGPACGPRDGWRTKTRAQLYKNRSTAMNPPLCTPGSANGLTALELRHDRMQPGKLQLKLKTRRSTLATLPIGPLRVTIVFGTTADAGESGVCASTLAFNAPSCVSSSRGARLRCG